MNLIKEILKRGLQGIVIGVFLVQTLGLVSILVSGNTESITTDFFIRQYIAGGAIGFAFGALNLLFQWDRIGIAGATIIHLIAVSMVFYPMGYFAGWISNEAMSIGGITIVLAISYFVIWLFCYLGWKRDIREINNSIKR